MSLILGHVVRLLHHLRGCLLQTFRDVLVNLRIIVLLGPWFSFGLLVPRWKARSRHQLAECTAPRGAAQSQTFE